MILVIGGIKGGTGKSTLAINLAVMRAYHRPTILVDADEQGSSDLFIKIRKYHKNTPGIEIITMEGREFSKTCESLKSIDNSDVVIDTGGRDTTNLRAAITIADQMIIPVKPRAFDIWSFKDTFKIAKEWQEYKKDFKLFAVINQADARGGENQQAQNLLDGLDEVTSSSELRLGNRKIYSKSILTGKGAIELSDYKQNKHKEELEKLYEAVYGTQFRRR